MVRYVRFYTRWRRRENDQFSTLRCTKTGSTQPKLSTACFVVQSCLADADFVVFSNYCLIGTRQKGVFYFLAHPKGFEPPFSRIGICCVIQLRHGQMYAAGYFACRFSFLIRIIFHLKINCKNCCATVFSLYYAVIIQQFFTLSKGNLSLLPTVRRSFCHTFEFFPDFVLLLLLFLQILEQF